MQLGRWFAIGLVALGAACGGGGGTTVTPAGGGTPAAPQAQTVMVMVGPSGAMAFAPSTVDLHAGDTVEWRWAGGPHTVTSGPPGTVDGRFCSVPGGTPVNAQTCNSTSYAQNTGFVYSQTFSTAGSFPYFCTVHGAMMSGVVNVR